MDCTLCSDTNLKVITDQIRHQEKATNVYYCQSCDLALLGSEQKDYKEYYNEEYRKKFTDDLEEKIANAEYMHNLHKNFQQDRLDLISPYFDKTKKFLEVGCSSGMFLTHIKDQFQSVAGNEFDETCASFVEKKLGIQVYTQDLDHYNIPNQSFDYIASFQVLEHTENPQFFLSKLKDLLKDDGKIFIEVPNLHDPLRVLWNVPAYEKFYYHEAHTHYFSKKSLEKLCQKCDLHIDSIHFLQDYNLFNHVYWSFNNAPQKNPLFGLNKPQFHLKDDFSKSKKRVEKFLIETDKQYKKILEEQEMTSNIFLILSKS